MGKEIVASILARKEEIKKSLQKLPVDNIKSQNKNKPKLLAKDWANTPDGFTDWNNDPNWGDHLNSNK